MTFKPRDIEPEKGNAYEHDRLNRKPQIDNFTLLLRNVSSPIVLSVNGGWGTGKTVFMKMLNVELQNQDCKSIYFSAWETDFAEDPLLAFLGEMNEVLSKDLGEKTEKSKALEATKKAGGYLLKKGIPALIKGATYGMLDAEKAVEGVIAKLTEDLSKDLIDEYSKNKKIIDKFKENITTLLTNEDGTIETLYIFVDELDRCRPTYSIELLERIKHLLDIEGLVFILGMDKEQLAHSVQGVYGSGFDGLGYLKRFVDIEYALPYPSEKEEIENFIIGLYDTYKLRTIFSLRSSHDSENEGDGRILIDIFIALSQHKRIPLRDIQQFFSKINLVIKMTAPYDRLYPELLAFLLYLKEYDTEIYTNYVVRQSFKPDLTKIEGILQDVIASKEPRIHKKIMALLIAANKKDSRDHYEVTNIIKKINMLDNFSFD